MFCVSLCKLMNGRDTRFYFLTLHTLKRMWHSQLFQCLPSKWGHNGILCHDILLRLNINRYWSISRFDLSVTIHKQHLQNCSESHFTRIWPYDLSKTGCVSLIFKSKAAVSFIAPWWLAAVQVINPAPVNEWDFSQNKNINYTSNTIFRNIILVI